MRTANGTDPSRARGIAVENAVLPKSSRFALMTLSVIALLVAVAPISPAAAQALPRMAWPTVGRETQPYGCTGFKWEPRRGSCAHFHAGIDIANRRGTPIRAAADGTVKYVGREPWYHGKNRAWVVIIDHGHGVKTIYVHLQVRRIPGVARGKHVVQGQLIGRMGSTGRATGPHLHFGVWLNGVGVDPTRYCPGVKPPLK